MDRLLNAAAYLPLILVTFAAANALGGHKQAAIGWAIAAAGGWLAWHALSAVVARTRGDAR